MKDKGSQPGALSALALGGQREAVLVWNVLARTPDDAPSALSAGATA
jgi:hypothetical protein